MATPQTTPIARLRPDQLRPMLQTFTERLYDTVNRGPILRCFATKSSRSRVDVTKFRNSDTQQLALDDGVGTQISDGADALVRDLIRHDNAKFRLQLDISHPDSEIREKNLALYYAITQGIVRGADAIYRETGLKSLWLAYPFLLIRDIADPENRRSILAPLYLWPVEISASLARQGELHIRRNPDAGPPILNRILAHWARTKLAVDIPQVELDSNGDGEVGISELQAAVDEMLRGIPRLEMCSLSDPLMRLPTRTDAESLPQPAVINSAVLGLFVSENQALIDNLEKLQHVEDVDEPLDSLLANRQVPPESAPLPPERERYLVTDSDPYQERAVWESRRPPGTIVHGPPGTGKSQTIVNIVADSLARGERVLVVCQKRAAIDVVFERLRGVGLSELCTVIHDAESDRRKLYSELKEQIAALRNVTPQGYAYQRQQLADQIDRHEKALEEYHRALYLRRDSIGLSYRQVIGRCTSAYNAQPGIRSSAALERLSDEIKSEDLDRIESSLQGIAQLWDAAKPKSNPWANRRHDFAVTRPVRDDILAAIASCEAAATALDRFVAAKGCAVDLPENLEDFRSAVRQWVEWTRTFIQGERIDHCAAWLERMDQQGGAGACQRV